MSLSTDLRLCHRALQLRVPLLIDAYAKAEAPWTLKITRAKATEAEQFALWVQGRYSVEVVNARRKAAGLWPITEAENKRTVTSRDGIRKVSEHQKGRAVDVVATNDPDGLGPLKASISWHEVRYLPLGPLAKKFGLVWGGWWTRVDRPHLELPPEVI